MTDCACERGLTEYVLVYVSESESYVNFDFIKRYGVIVDTGERNHALTKNNPHDFVRIVYAFTIADAFRLVEYEAGQLNRQPLHRVLDEDREVLYNCTVGKVELPLVHTDAYSDLAKLALERFLAR